MFFNGDSEAALNCLSVFSMRGIYLLFWKVMTNIQQNCSKYVFWCLCISIYVYVNPLGLLRLAFPLVCWVVPDSPHG